MVKSNSLQLRVEAAARMIVTYRYKMEFGDLGLMISRCFRYLSGGIWSCFCFIHIQDVDSSMTRNRDWKSKNIYSMSTKWWFFTLDNMIGRKKNRLNVQTQEHIVYYPKTLIYHRGKGSTKNSQKKKRNIPKKKKFHVSPMIPGMTPILPMFFVERHFWCLWIG